MIELVAAWIATIAGIVTIGHILDQWMDDAARRSLSDKIYTVISRDPLHWVHVINKSFLIIFERVYRGQPTLFNINAWRTILFCYVILFLGRLLFWFFDVPVPTTEFILIMTLTISFGCVLLFQGFLGAIEVIRYSIDHDTLAMTDFLDYLKRNKHIIVKLTLGMIGSAIYAATVLIVGLEVGFSRNSLIALSCGSALAVPVSALAIMVPVHTYTVNPLRALISSLLFMSLLSLLFPSAAKTFITQIENGSYFILSFVAFNIFADAVSLVETRWILMRSQGGSFKLMATFLLLDLILSGLIYLLLPALARQNPVTLGEGILFRGQMPWIGILFWTTFSTSILCYLFFFSVILINVSRPLIEMWKPKDKWISLQNHPIRSIALGMTMIVSIGFFLLFIFR